MLSARISDKIKECRFFLSQLADYEKAGDIPLADNVPRPEFRERVAAELGLFKQMLDPIQRRMKLRK
jgi:hypothetical protein